MKLNEIAQISVLPRRIVNALNKSRQGGPKLLFVSSDAPGRGDGVDEVVDVDDVPPAGSVGGAVRIKHVQSNLFRMEYRWRDIVKSPTFDDEWMLTSKVIDGTSYVILHRTTEEAIDFVTNRLTSDNLMLDTTV